MQLKYYRIRELASVPARADKPAREGRYPWSGATIWRWVAARKFPAPVKLTSGTTAWRGDVLDAWEQARASAPLDIEGAKRAGAASVAARRAKRGAIGEGAK